MTVEPLLLRAAVRVNARADCKRDLWRIAQGPKRSRVDLLLGREEHEAEVIELRGGRARRRTSAKHATLRADWLKVVARFVARENPVNIMSCAIGRTDIQLGRTAMVGLARGIANSFFRHAELGGISREPASDGRF